MSKKGLEFTWKTIRNAFILGGLFFFSTLGNKELALAGILPYLKFIGVYIFMELSHYFTIAKPESQAMMQTPVKMLLF